MLLLIAFRAIQNYTVVAYIKQGAGNLKAPNIKRFTMILVILIIVVIIA